MRFHPLFERHLNLQQIKQSANGNTLFFSSYRKLSNTAFKQQTIWYVNALDTWWINAAIIDELKKQILTNETFH